jgi:hypothetical protein
MPCLSPLTRRSLISVAALALLAGCRDRSPAPATDSSLAQDLAMAQRPGAAPSVFNDAPVAAKAPTPAAATPAPRPAPARSKAPRPTPRRENPPAPVARTPDPRPPEQVAEQPAATPAPSPAPAAGIIGAGARVGMTTNGRVCANSALAGDKFTATVTSEIVGSNGATIAAGSTVVLEVASVNRADPIEQSRIDFRVRAIDVNGTSQPVDGNVATLGSLETVQSSSGNDKTKVIGGAIAGAVLGRIFGRSTKATVIGGAAGAAAGAAAAHASRSTDACLPVGSTLQLTLSREIVVQHAGAI